MHNLLKVKSKIADYTISFVEDLSAINKVIDQPNTITIIDENVNNLYPTLQRIDNVVVLSNEDAKTMESASTLLQILSQRKANINTRLVAIGGGVIQDLVGFCASVYCRGVSYTLVPTTLLAQADSCVGGKTSINLANKKNIVGTFYPPTDILIYTGFLSTLSDQDYISGLGEIYKFHILQNKIDSFDPNADVSPMILDGLNYKISILDLDEFDKGERKFLNYGHTFGHALESTSEYKIPHGIAVIIGSMIATEIAKRLGYSVADYNTIMQKGQSLIHKSNIKLNPDWFDFEKLMDVVKSDKKSTGKLTMVFVDDKPFLEIVENMSIVEESLKQVYEII
jgi:3-dehydroquinate synthase